MDYLEDSGLLEHDGPNDDNFFTDSTPAEIITSKLCDAIRDGRAYRGGIDLDELRLYLAERCEDRVRRIDHNIDAGHYDHLEDEIREDILFDRDVTDTDAQALRAQLDSTEPVPANASLYAAFSYLLDLLKGDA